MFPKKNFKFQQDSTIEQSKSTKEVKQLTLEHLEQKKVLERKEELNLPTVIHKKKKSMKQVYPLLRGTHLAEL